MGLTAGKDYVFVPLVDMNEGLMSGTVTKACMVCVPARFYVVPIESFTVLGFDATDTRYGGKPEETVRKLLEEQDQTVPSLEERLREMLEKEPTRWIYDVASLEKFSVKTGLLGGMTFKRSGDSRKAMNIRGKEHKLSVHDFYAGMLKE